MSRPTWMSSDLAIIAHRGGAALGRENSIPVLEASLAAGAAAVEVDVQQLGDGCLVLTHDGYLMLGDQWLWVRDLNRVEFETATGAPATLLADFLVALSGLGLGLYLEVKAVSPDGVSHALEQISHNNLESRTVVGSFRADVVSQVARDGRVPASILYRDRWADPLAMASDLGAQFVHPCFDDDPWMIEIMRGAWLERLHAASIGVVGWNVNDVELLNKMRELPLQAACTDDPRIAGAM